MMSSYPFVPTVQHGATRVDRMDHVATVTAAVCAIHCVVSPIVLSLLPLLAGRLIGPGLEWGFTATSLVLGVVSLGHSYRALHRNPFPLACFCLGLSILVAARLVGERAPSIELTAVGLGASCIIFAHAVNVRMRRRVHASRACPCPCHDAGTGTAAQ